MCDTISKSIDSEILSDINVGDCGAGVLDSNEWDVTVGDSESIAGDRCEVRPGGHDGVHGDGTRRTGIAHKHVVVRERSVHNRGECYTLCPLCIYYAIIILNNITY